MFEQKPGDRRRDFPLTALFLLVAFVAICIALVRVNIDEAEKQEPARRNSISDAVLVLFSLGSGALVGAVTGIQYFCRVRGLLLGLVLGLATGGFAGFLLINGRMLYPLTFGVSLLFLTALLFWFMSKRRSPRDISTSYVEPDEPF